MKILVSYFSASGVTKEVANKINNIIQGDLFEIEPSIKYTKEDLNWMDKNSRSSIEMNDLNSRPSIKNKIENIDLYDKIIIGFPVWWYTAPTIISTFIEENNLMGKDVYIFVTSGGSGVSKSFDDLMKKYPNINFISGRRFNINVTTEEIIDWLRI